jgi:deferrochelatase/peroxidase EfeB
MGADKRPKELKPFTPIRGTVHTATAAEGDILFPIRPERFDFCFEFERIHRISHFTTIVDNDGKERDILSDNMSFGRAGHGEFVTYFIGYSRYLWVIEKLLQGMFVEDPVGDYDRLLDFLKAITGLTFFAPSRPTLQAIERSSHP